MVLKFIADENISKSTIELLRNLQHDVLSIYDVKLNGASDVDLVEYAISNYRIILTLDKDFGEIYYFAHQEKFGVILVRVKTQTVEIVNEAIIRFLKNNIPENINFYKTLIILSENKIRYYYT